jgi:O-antigen/teichoic acid export membrane protein
MNNLQNILKNTLVIYISQAISHLMNFLLIIIIARYLGTDGLGQFTLAFSYLIIFQTLSQFGLGEFLIREISRDKENFNKYFLNAVVIRIAISLIVLLFLNFLLYLMNYPHEVTRAILILCFCLIPNAISQVCETSFKAFEKMEYNAIVALLTSFLKTTIGIMLITSGGGIVGIAFMFLMIAVFSLCLDLFFLFRNIIKPKLLINFSYNFVKHLLKNSSLFFLISVLVIIFYRIDIIMLSKMSEISEIGKYGASYRFLKLFFGAAGSFNIALYPVLSKLFISSKETFDNIYENSIKYELIIILPIVILFYFFSDEILIFTYGDKFIHSSAVFKILILTAIPFSINYTFAHVILASNNQGITFRVATINAILNIFLNYLLIPRYGACGAAIATLTTFTIAAIQNYIFIHANLCRISLLQIFVKPIFVASLVSLIILLLLKQINVILIISITLSLYVVLLAKMKLITKYDVQVIKKTLRAEVR